uniref:Uncharacterized protein n=1 Tax=Pararge aegeria TaxID=116150 RepID=S4PK98_9NEOP
MIKFNKDTSNSSPNKKKNRNKKKNKPAAAVITAKVATISDEKLTDKIQIAASKKLKNKMKKKQKKVGQLNGKKANKPKVDDKPKTFKKNKMKSKN